MAEWSIAHAWKACVVKSNREFESLSLRHSPGCFFRKFQAIFCLIGLLSLQFGVGRGVFVLRFDVFLLPPLFPFRCAYF